jgi:Uma2 family endonuclease
MQAQNTIFADSVATIPKIWTEEALEQLASETDKQYELVNGEPKEKESESMEHSYIAAILNRRLGNFVEAKKLGVVLESSGSFRMIAGNIRKPDVSFITKERITEKRPSFTAFEGAPDLAVEVISPTDIWWEIMQKLDEYFSSGCRLVWLISPLDQRVLVYRQEQRSQILELGDLLDGEEVVPGFSMPVADLFAEFDF